MLFPTDEKSFDLGSVYVAFHISDLTFRRKHIGPHPVRIMSHNTESITFLRSPPVLFSVENEGDIKFVHSSDQTGYKGE